MEHHGTTVSYGDTARVVVSENYCSNTGTRRLLDGEGGVHNVESSRI